MAGTQVPDDLSLTPELRTLGHLWPYLWSEQTFAIRMRFIIAMVCLVLAKVATLLIPQFFKGAVNALSPITGELILVPIFMILAYGVARLLSTLFAEIRDAVFSTVIQEAVRSVGLTVFTHLHNLSLRYHLDRQTGGLSRSIERGTKGIENLLYFLTFNIIPSLLEILLVCALLWVLYGWTYAIVTFDSMVIYIVYTILITNWRISYVRTMNQTDNEANAKAVDSLLNYETVKYFNNEKHETLQYDHSLVRYRKAAITSKLTLSYLNGGQSIVITVSLIILMLLGGKDVQNGNFTVGDFVALNTYLIQLYTPLNLLGLAYREVKISMVNMENMLGLIDEPCEIEDKKGAKPITFKKGSISFNHVHFGYTKNRQILKDVSFKVPAGKTVAIIGSSGAGKSTISRLLFRFYDVTEGSITIDGQDIREVTQDSVRRLIGIVPQDTVLFNDTIFYNIAYGRPSATRKEVIEAAKSAQIHDFIISLPEEYDTRVGERGLKLSGGEKQRVAIARTLLKKPKIFLFDEATSALDSRTEKQIQQSLSQLSHNFTTLIIAHRLSTIVDADTIIVLDKGRIVEEGTHKELLKAKGIYAAMWERQQG